MECFQIGKAVQSTTEQTTQTFSREGPLVEERKKIEKPENVVILADGRTKNNFRNKPTGNLMDGPTTKFCPSCGNMNCTISH